MAPSRSKMPAISVFGDPAEQYGEIADDSRSNEGTQGDQQRPAMLFALPRPSPQVSKFCHRPMGQHHGIID
jgi:hypothetical protein